ncbi:MAG: ATP-dependent RNA helicase HrpA [Burkholderia sp.]|jgi:ATP-dependent helicase HrpA
MSDRALFDAFQKVRGDVESALAETRKKKEKERAAEEERERAEKRAKKEAAAAALRARAKAEEARAASARPAQEGRKSAPPKAAAARRAPLSAAAAAAAPLAAARRLAQKGAVHAAKAPRSTVPHRIAAAAPAEAKPPRRRAPRPKLSYEERRNPVPPFTLMPGLPVSERGEEIAEAIRANRVVIVCGETGSGKTTQLPKIAMMAGRGEHGMIAHTQPRRIAASSIAKRIAEELKTPLGEVVGYKVRFTDQTSAGATIKLMTDGILLAETQTDPMLRAYDTVIIDEAHERSINIDFLLGYLKRLLEKRKDLKVIVTSATIDAERFAAHFAENGRPAPILTVSGRTYPVEIRYRPLEDADEADDRTMLAAIDNAVGELEASGPGDVLVFLPGEREIRETADYLRRSRRPTTEILPLFARLSAADQEKVFHPSGRRRIVLATNVAETSITVPGIRYVVDTGTARVKRYSYRNKVEQLLIEPISQASANQRAGRCGRVANGICIRLYSESDFEGRPPFTDPEILRSNLAAVILRAMALRLGDIREFPFVQAPPPRAIADGYAILQELNAVTEKNELTPIGRELARLPVDPRLARMLLEGARRQSLEELLIICSGLSVQDPRERPLDAQQAADEAHRRFADDKSDFLSFVKLWRWHEKAFAEKESNRKFDAELKRFFLSPRRMREWRDVWRQLSQLTDELGWRRNTAPATFEQVHRALLTGLLGNIGSKAAESDFRAPPYLGARGIRFWLWPGSVRAKKGGRWIMAAEIVETSRLFARCTAEIEPEWIEEAAGDLMRRSWSEPHWEKSRGEVCAYERGVLYGLTIYQGRRVSLAPHDAKTAREIFIREALVEGNWGESAPFYSHNGRLIAEIRELEHKTRRPDVLVDEDMLYAFYDERIPETVVGTATLKKWLAEEDRTDPKRLYMTREALMKHDASGVTNRYYPKTLEMGGVTMALSYLFEPGSPRDGLTVTVPLYALNLIDPVRAEWLVPGMVKEKAWCLLKSLPQKIRRNCVPIEGYAKAFFERTNEGEPQGVPFREALARDIRENAGVPCQSTDFKAEQLPPHLIMNFKVVDEHGRQLDMGRNLAELRASLGEAAQQTFRTVAAQDKSVAKELDDHITDWTFGELPEIMEISRKGQTMIGYPALVDCGDSCAIEVYDDPQEAAAEHRRGLIRLFRLSLKEQVKFIARSLRDLGRVQMQAQLVPGLSKLFESADELADQVIDCALRATALAEPIPADRAAFEKRREDVKGRLTLVAGEISRLLKEIVEQAAQIPPKLKRLSDEKSLADDVVNQLNTLFAPGFLQNVPLRQLSHYPRYLKAVNWRLDRFRNDPERDAARQRDIEQLTVPYLRARAERKGRSDPQLDDFGWLLQELRVSLFAQQLRTPMPVSCKRLQRVWNMIKRL